MYFLKMNNGIVWFIIIIDRSSIDKSSFNLSLIKFMIIDIFMKVFFGYVICDIGIVIIFLVFVFVCRIRI